MSGAFEGLDELVRNRVGRPQLGFAAESRESAGAWMQEIQTADFIRFGLEPEFIGRLPVRVCCEPLTETDLYDILTRSEVSPLRQVRDSFDAYGIRIGFDDCALREIALRALAQKTGARGLVTVLERVLREAKFQLPSTDLHSLTITRAFVEKPSEGLAGCMTEDYQRRDAVRQAIDAFTVEFHRRHGFTLAFASDAHALIYAAVQGHADHVLPWCRDRFANFEYGLKIIRDRVGQDRFEIDASAARDPDSTLSRWVREAVRQSDAPTARHE